MQLLLDKESQGSKRPILKLLSKSALQGIAWNEGRHLLSAFFMPIGSGGRAGTFGADAGFAFGLIRY